MSFLKMSKIQKLQDNNGQIQIQLLKSLSVHSNHVKIKKWKLVDYLVITINLYLFDTLTFYLLVIKGNTMCVYTFFLLVCVYPPFLLINIILIKIVS